MQTMGNQAGQGNLSQIEQYFTALFRVDELETDLAFSRFVPMVYDPVGFPWRDVFEPGFVRRFNGLMIRGREHVGKIWCIAFPAEEVLDRIVARAQTGDIIFSHHPIDMKCGDPRGAPGQGFIPIPPARIAALKDAGFSFYSCHVPLDSHPELSTSDAIVRAIGGRIVEQFYPYGNGYAGRLCEIPPTRLDDLVATCQRALSLPYVDRQGNTGRDDITRVAVIAGGGGSVDFYKEADRLGADCLLAGEVTSKIDNDYGRSQQAEIARYLPTTDLVAIGLSHAGSEFFVMRELAPYFEHEFGVPAEVVPESRWWR
ncbi:MAG: Nif3-like dinuclear metal center hexameric protein [Thermomicrobiales bacterium]